MEQDFGTVNAFDYALPYDTPPRPVCKYFITKGFCWEGDDCRSRHTTHENLEMEATDQAICESLVKKGYCLAGASCKFQHPSHKARTTTETPDRQYTVDELKTIGTACSTRLPPASAVQAMFLYEMQRHSEVEALFKAQMFRLARAEDASNATGARLGKVEDDVKDVKKQVTSQEVEERLATSRVRFNAQQTKIDACDQKLELHNHRMEALSADIKALEVAPKDNIEPAVTEEEILSDMQALKNDIEALFDERDALIDMMKQSNTRIDKLEDLVRQLTIQMLTTTSSQSNGSSPAVPQRIPIQTTNGVMVDLSVPKGSGITTRKENRSPIRSFTPGKQWAA